MLPGLLFLVRPAWAHSCGWKSRRKLITANEVKRNCVRATEERGKEARNINRERMNKNRIEGAAKQGERAKHREALVIKARWRRSGGCAVKECDPYPMGDLASCLKGRWRKLEREVSGGRSSRGRRRGGWKPSMKGRGNRRGSLPIIRDGASQMFASAKLASMANGVKPDQSWQRENQLCRIGDRQPQAIEPAAAQARHLTTPTARCGPACRVVWQGA